MMRANWAPGGKNATGRGGGQYVRISMTQALTYVAQEMQRINSTYGPGAIGVYASSNDEHVGVHGIGNYARVIEQFAGGYTAISEPTYSSPGWAYGGSFVWGYNWQKGFCDQTDLNWDVTHNSTLLVFWGTNPTITNMQTDGPSGDLLHQYFIQLGKKAVVIGPRYNETAMAFEKANVTYIPIIPGTDCAMMAAVAYVWIQAGTYNKKYVSTHTIGFDSTTLPTGAPANSSFSDYILGNSDGIPKTPQWASAICGVDARRITALAQDWAANTTALVSASSGGPNRAEWGHEWTRFCAVLLAMQGWGAPGVDSWNGSGGWPGQTGMYSAATAASNYYTMPAPTLPGSASNGVKQVLLRLGGFPAAILNGSYTWHGYDLSSTTTAAFQTFTYPMTGYSPIKMMFCESGSHLNQRCNSNHNAQAYASPNLQFIVQVSPWWEGTCNYADIILPACTPLEQADVLSNGTIHCFYMYQAQAVQPLGESMSDFDLAQALATNLGVGQQFAGGQNSGSDSADRVQ